MSDDTLNDGAPTLRRNLSQSGRHTLAGDKLAMKILLAARGLLIEKGFSGFSVRKVAQAAGVSLGHLQHYFPTKSALLQAMLVSIEEEFYQHYLEEIVPIKDPVERFVACARFVLEVGPEHQHVPLLREFWVLASRDEAVAESLSEFYRSCRRFAAAMLAEANADLDWEEARRRSCTAVSALSGAFLYLDPWQGGDELDDFREHLIDLMRRIAFLPAGAEPAEA